jgi:hypothetical protein
MNSERQISFEETRSVESQIGTDWAKIDLEPFRHGLEVELEHGAYDRETNITGDDLILTGKIASVYLTEVHDYYRWLNQIESEAKAEARDNLLAITWA